MCTQAQLNAIANAMVNCYRSIYGKNIAGIFLYGSYARGDYNHESDIDITTAVRGKRLDLQNKLKAIWNASADIGLEHDVVISPAVISYDEFEQYKETLPYILILKKRESGLDSLVKYRLENAKEKLESAKLLLEAGHYKDSIGRWYYAAFTAVRAVLAKDRIDFSKHSGVIAYFQKEYRKVESLINSIQSVYKVRLK